MKVHYQLEEESLEHLLPVVKAFLQAAFLAMQSAVIAMAIPSVRHTLVPYPDE